MKHASFWVAAAAAVAAAALIVPLANSQVQASPSLLPIGVAAAGSASMAWFHEPGSRRVVACQSSTGGTTPSIQCVAATLP